MVAAVAPSPTLASVTYVHRGAAQSLFATRDAEIVLSGPAGTGKTLACLRKLHLAALKYPGMRALMVRKVLEDMKASALVTFTEQVLAHGNFGVVPFGGSKLKPAAFRYPNGSEIIVGGLDKPRKVMSSEYDLVYANEATDLAEHDWESLLSRLRHGVMPYQQIIGDCNPDSPSHWLYQRAERGITTMRPSTHRDNPAYWDEQTQAWTPDGAAYMEKLERLTGVRRLRLLDGKWAAAEGLVYDDWNPTVHLVPPDRLPSLQSATHRLAGVDWGFTNAGVLHVWLIDGDGRMALVHEIYMSRKTIDWWLAKGRDVQDRYHIDTFVCDPSEPAYIQQFNDAGLWAVPAINDILPGIGAVQQRLPVQPDGRPRLVLSTEALEEADPELIESKLPWCTAQEFDAYVWAVSPSGRANKDKPADAHNHGLDTARYVAAHLDLRREGRLHPASEELQHAFRGLIADEGEPDGWGDPWRYGM